MSQPQDAFPDLHHRMSKKIAQLTKVIYHLNTKNDVHELEMKGVQQLYESEIDEVSLPETSFLCFYYYIPFA
jgi:hypothetical protein